MLKAISATVEKEFLQINQYSFSKDGSLNIYSQLRQLLADHPEYIVAATDEHTAFQRASRIKMKKTLIDKFQDYVPFFEASYGQAAELFYEGRKMEDAKSRHGSQQGCPWGGLAYCSAKMEDMRTLMNNNRHVLFLCFMDDIFMIGRPEDVAKAFSDWSAMTTESGGLANLGKCKFYSPSAASGQHREIQALLDIPAIPATPDTPGTPGISGAKLVPPEEGLRCLGYPLGSVGFCKDFYNEKAEETERCVEKISELADYGHEIAIQCSYLLLRYCCEPKIAHLLRAAPPEDIAEA